MTSFYFCDVDAWQPSVATRYSWLSLVPSCCASICAHSRWYSGVASGEEKRLFDSIYGRLRRYALGSLPQVQSRSVSKSHAMPYIVRLTTALRSLRMVNSP